MLMGGDHFIGDARWDKLNELARTYISVFQSRVDLIMVQSFGDMKRHIPILARRTALWICTFIFFYAITIIFGGTFNTTAIIIFALLVTIIIILFFAVTGYLLEAWNNILKEAISVCVGLVLRSLSTILLRSHMRGPISAAGILLSIVSVVLFMVN